MNELMKQQKQLKLMCYKVEIVMSTEAWYFLHGTTNGVCNLTCRYPQEIPPHSH